ncbi:Abcg1 [Symbiodinium sp. CCMP2456]|nr:Abcg1 [Symbiodinium sp. CCMP2456]
MAGQAVDGDGCHHRLIETLEEGFTSEESSAIPSPMPGNGLSRRFQRRPQANSWQSDDPSMEDQTAGAWEIGRTRFSSFGGSPMELRWEALSMRSWQVVRKHQEAVQILTNVSGCARSGKLTCILGPSGAGKSTLLNVLAGRQSGGQRHRIGITGKVWVSGQRVDPRAVRSRIAYVMQKDEMFATSTPQEALSFSASLRLSGPREDRKELISELLGSLGLLGCANTYIGNAVINGLSGGQRKRTAIGVELITRPDIVCLDEPFGD